MSVFNLALEESGAPLVGSQTASDEHDMGRSALPLILTFSALVVVVAKASSSCDVLPPCSCRKNDAVDCDGASFVSIFPSTLPASTREFSIRGAALQELPSGSLIHLRSLQKLDLSDNSIRRLPERLLVGVEESIETLVVKNNLLGDHLNPVFSWPQLRGLKRLKKLDVSGNWLKSLEAGFVEGCEHLKELLLSRNDLEEVPSAALNGPKSLKTIALDSNKISSISSSAFVSQRLLETINLAKNGLKNIESGALAGLSRLRYAAFNHNILSKLDSNTFQGAENLEHLDLSDNVMSEIPSIALDSLPYLKILNLSSNSIQSVQNKDLQRHTSLEVLDLSRNAISSLGSGTFLGLRALRVLDLGVNALRAVEDDAFEGLSALSSLSLRDNNALLVPSSALGRLPLLVHLRLDFNRVAAVSSDLLPDIAPALRSLDLSHNVVRELPPDAFRRFSSLRWLSLSGNRLSALEEASLAGLERALESLSLDYNRLQRLPALRLPRLETLSAAHNRLVSFPDLTFLPHLRHLSLANNPQAGAALSPLALPPALVSLDLSATGLSSPPVFPPPNALRSLNLNQNSLSQLRDDAFLALSSLRHLDLSHNSIADIRDFALRGLSSLRNLSLAFNLLSSVQTGLLDHSPLIEALDLSNNRLSLLLPSALAPLTRLRILRLSSNPLSALPPDLFRGLPLLQRVDLSSNHLSAVGAGAFADLPLLRHLSLASNRISSLDEGAFSRSPQLRFLNLSDNALERLSGRTFEGLSSLEVDLSRNRLSALPDALFDSSRVRSLRSVDLSSNLFFTAPFSSLHSQHSSLEHLSLANNSLEHLPRGDLLLHLKSFDLSSNALSSDVLSHVLSEPKTTRTLFLSATGLRRLPPLETPFLRVLDLSRNAISEIPPTTFDRTTSLQMLDLSYNALLQIGDSLRRVWRALPFLRHLDLSGNAIAEIGKDDLRGLEDLSTFRLTRMPFLRTMHADAFHNISRLESLSLHGLPLLGYLEAAGLLRSAPHSLRSLDVEPSESILAEGPSVPLRHRLRRLVLWGNRLQGLAPGSLAGLSAPDLEIRLLDTQVTSIPPTLFFPLPKSSKIILDISGAKMTSVPSSLLASFDSRKETLEVRGLQWNPISCDCSARSLRRWLLFRRLSDGAVCASPPSLSGRRLPDKVSEEDLGCERRSTDAVSTSTATPTSAEPEIIWSLPPAPSPAPNLREEKPERPAANDDALVVGVVGGVVAFIALLAAGICVARVRLSAGGRYRGGPLAAGQRTPAGMECACRPASKPMPPLYVSRTPYLVAMDSDRW